MKDNAENNGSRLQFDPQGPDELQMPRGRFNFAHLTLVLLATTVVIIVVGALTVG